VLSNTNNSVSSLSYTQNDTSMATNNNDKNVTVYITKTGSKYHFNGCQYLRRSKIPTTLDNALNRGYTPCSRCNSPR